MQRMNHLETSIFVIVFLAVAVNYHYWYRRMRDVLKSHKMPVSSPLSGFSGFGILRDIHSIRTLKDKIEPEEERDKVTRVLNMTDGSFFVGIVILVITGMILMR